MEKTYKILKWLAVVLAAAVVIVGGWKLAGSRAEPQPAAETTEAAYQTEPTAPDCTVYDLDGNAYTLSDFRGKPVILNFWASWCGPCKAEMPDFEKKYQEYGDDIHFLIVNLTDGRSETVETASDYIAQQGYTFPVYYDTDMDAALTYSISSIPMSYFIDAEGHQVSSHLGMMSADDLQTEIDRLLSAE